MQGHARSEGADGVMRLFIWHCGSGATEMREPAGRATGVRGARRRADRHGREWNLGADAAAAGLWCCSEAGAVCQRRPFQRVGGVRGDVGLVLVLDERAGPVQCVRRGFQPAARVRSGRARVRALCGKQPRRGGRMAAGVLGPRKRQVLWERRSEGNVECQRAGDSRVCGDELAVYSDDAGASAANVERGVECDNDAGELDARRRKQHGEPAAACDAGAVAGEEQRGKGDGS